MNRPLTFALAGLLAAIPAAAQFGGRPGDTVILVVTHHGPSEVRTAPPGTQNTAAQLSGFRAVDMAGLPLEEVVANFPGRKTQVARRDADDRFEMITQEENIPIPRTAILTPSKVFTMSGVIRNDNAGGKGPIYLIGGALVPFQQDVTIGSERSLSEFKAIFWRPNASVAPFREVPADYIGPGDPPGLTGLEYQQSITKLPLFLLWEPIRKIDPAGGWPAGVDLKLLEHDATIPSTIRLLRLRPGRKTPEFRIAGRTHLFVLEGGAQVSAAGGQSVRIGVNWHVYVPGGTVIRLSNPKEFVEPGKAGID